jgi:Fe-S-cluster containining protein
MTGATNLAVLPPLYAAWMDELLPGPIRAEGLATCHDCAMCAPAGGAPAWGGPYFEADLKCCTYLPTVWSFLAGRILNDHSPEAAEGRASLERRIDAGVAVTPLGLGRTPVHHLLYQKVDLTSFGQARSLRCPHYLEESGGCGIWRYRESTCATYFCKFERGYVGKEFWDLMHWMLVSAEVALARWCALELDVGTEALALLLPGSGEAATALTAGELDGRVAPAEYRRRWGRWAGREREYYHAAAGLVVPLGWGQIEALAGPELRARKTLLLAAYEKMSSEEIPDRLWALPIQVQFQGATDGRVVVEGGVGPLRLPGELVDQLHRFDGRPTAEVLGEIRKAAGLELTPGLVRKLVDYGILGGRTE